MRERLGRLDEQTYDGEGLPTMRVRGPALDLLGGFSDPVRVDVWSGRLEVGDPRIEELTDLLSADEMERAQRFRSSALWRRFVVRRGFLRLLIADACGVSPVAVRLGADGYGKPYLRTPSHPLRFNVSHSDDLALFAFTSAAAFIGIDVESCRAVEDREAIVSRFFAVEERAALARVPSGQRDLAFLQCWTRKEAYVKALGPGLSVPLNSFAVSIGAGRPTVLRKHPEDRNSWALFDLDLGSEYTGALAVALPD